MVTFLFSVLTITEAKQYAGLGRAEPGRDPGRWIFQPGHLTWYSAATDSLPSAGPHVCDSGSIISSCFAARLSVFVASF